MRGYAEEDLPVSEGLAHQRDLVVLQVAQAAVDQARRPLRRPARDVPLIEKQDVEAAHGGVPCDAGPVYPGPDDYEVERVVPDVLRHSRGHGGPPYSPWSFDSVRASIAASTHSSASEPAEAMTPAAKAPSTNGASTRRTAARLSEDSISKTVSAERTADPRSMKTSTSSASRPSMPPWIRSVSVPKVPSASPPTAATSTSPAIWRTSSAVPSAICGLGETSTHPPIRRTAPGCGPPRPGADTSSGRRGPRAPPSAPPQCPQPRPRFCPGARSRRAGTLCRRAGRPHRRPCRLAPSRRP